MYASSISDLSNIAVKLMAYQGFNVYSFGTAAWFTLQAVPLMLTPSIIETLLSPDLHQLTGMFQHVPLYCSTTSDAVTSARGVLLPIIRHCTVNARPTMRSTYWFDSIDYD